MSETSELTGPLVKALEKAGCLVFRMQSGKLRKGRNWVQLCPKGTADILCFPRSGGVVWIETKTPMGKTNPEQVEAQADFRERVEAFGHLYLRVETLAEGLGFLRQKHMLD